MADILYRPRGEHPPDDLRRRLAALLDELGPRNLSKKLGMARDCILGIAAGCRALPGSLALLRERLPALELQARCASAIRAHGGSPAAAARALGLQIDAAQLLDAASGGEISPEARAELEALRGEP